CQHGSGSPYSF
nr:immunoglobulin light chain junction region [Macaca mulatta]